MIVFNEMVRKKKQKPDGLLHHPPECWCAICGQAEYMGLIHGNFNGAPVVFPIFEKEFLQEVESEEDFDQLVFACDRPAMPILVDHEDDVVVMSDTYPIRVH